jgi:hypothetical protein
LNQKEVDFVALLVVPRLFVQLKSQIRAQESFVGKERSLDELAELVNLQPAVYLTEPLLRFANGIG